ncbi:MAG: energy-coupling factor transporter transmembrane protein EcfT [Firmicutes bacterium]|nr:energy-coupling factor transporter transmembrane protein EcfT [Bacillota bacterium]
MIKLDFRSKITVFLGTVFLASVLSKDIVFFMLIILLTFYLLILNYCKETITFLVAIGIISLLRVISSGKGFGVLLPEMFLFILLRTIAIIMSVVPIIKTPPGELMVMMRKLRVPRSISLSMIFMMRFLPIIKNEFREIIDALKLRGLFSYKSPLLTMEYVFVPMMFSASKVAEELAAASEVRGISANGKHTSRRRIKFGIVDVFTTVVSIVLSLGLYYLEGKLRI